MCLGSSWFWRGRNRLFISVVSAEPSEPGCCWVSDVGHFAAQFPCAPGEEGPDGSWGREHAHTCASPSRGRFLTLTYDFLSWRNPRFWQVTFIYFYSNWDFLPFLIRPMVNKDAQFFPHSHLLTIFFIICFVFLHWVLCHFPILIFFPNVQSDAWFSILNELEFLSHVLKAQYQILIHQLYFLFPVRYSTWVKIICPANPQLAAFSGTCKQQSNTVQKWLLLLISLTCAFLSVRQPSGGSLLSSPVPSDTWSMTQTLLVEAYVD